METATDRVRKMADVMLADLRVLLEKHSGIHDANDKSSSVVILGAQYEFRPLGQEGARLQSKILGKLPTLMGLMRALLSRHCEATRNALDTTEKTIRDVVEQQRLTWHSSPAEAIEAVTTELGHILDTLHALYDAAEGSVALVPDTNALLYNTMLAEWAFSDIPSFDLVLVPGVLSELDALKVNHRNPDVREKAEGLIRQIKEFRRRGAITEGVPIVRDRISVRAMAVEPNVRDALDWLSPDSSDDRILASVIELMRRHPRTEVALITRDINLQNKADFACIPYFEPPSSIKANT